MATRPGYHRSVQVLGARLPLALALLGGAILSASILGALVKPVYLWGVLYPKAVLAGQIWRLLTWGFFAMEPISLVFACLVLYWFGKDLAGTWGPWRFVAFFWGISAASGMLTCLAALVWLPLGTIPFASPWPALTAMIIAWARLHPGRQILFFFLFPMRGQMLVYVTVGMTLLYAIFNGLAFFFPELIAQGMVLLYMGGLRRLWLTTQLALLERRLRRRVSGLRSVERDEPPRWLH